MQAATVELLGLFDRDIRYLVPIFQRNYRWEEGEHWAPLWDDLRKVADEILTFGDGTDVADHFLGAIVCEQQPSFGRDAQAVAVIDGQQRLMTLQLLLAGAARVAQSRVPSETDYLTGLLRNRDAVAKGRVEHQYKVWPNVRDRDSFSSAMEGSDGPSSLERAVAFFAGAIETWLDEGDAEDPLDDADHTPEERMDALISALTRHLKLVKIDLEASDNAQLIFETLNARGERLTDADLIRNYLFRLADERGLNAEALHSAHWQQFDAAKWTERIAHGRHQRERLELYLNYWLSMRRLKEVPASRIFPEFKEHVGKQRDQPDVVASDIAVHAEVFDSFGKHPVDTPEWWFFRRVAEMDLITVYPVALWLFAQGEQRLTIDARRRALLAIESFLIRRLIGRESTRSYGALFIEILKAAASGDPSEADRRIVSLLADKTADADRWPSDDAVRSSILNTNVYRLKQSRLVMILEAIERYMVDDGRSEVMKLGNALWIEHLMPQGWRLSEAWRLPSNVEDPTAAGLNRDHIIHTLGNLTLTTSKLDIELSNRPWNEKLAALETSSALALNREVLAHRQPWDEAAIRQRGERLAERALAIWPGPDTFAT
jgi:hypothetical protein